MDKQGEILQNLEARLAGSDVKAQKNLTDSRREAYHRARAEAGRAEAEQHRQAQKQSLFRREIVTVFRDRVCNRDVVDRMPADVRRRINDGTDGATLIRRGPNYTISSLDKWLLSCINDGNEAAHPLFDQDDICFKVIRNWFLSSSRLLTLI